MSAITSIDDIDEHLIGALVEDGRRTSRSLADEVALTDGAVAARIRRMVEQGVLKIAPQFDWYAAGFRRFAQAYIRVRGDGPLSVGAALAGLGGVLSVEVTYGAENLILMLLAENDPAMHRIVETVRSTPGVDGLRVNQMVELFSWVRSYAFLPYEPTPLDQFPDPPFVLDDLDHAIIARLRADGRESNREIASQVGTSDATVRTRRKRLEDAGLMRLRAVVDPMRIGRIGSIANVGLSVSGDVGRFVRRLAAEPFTAYCATSLGDHNVVCGVVAENQEELARALNETLWTLPGVCGVTAWPLASVIAHRSDLVRFI
jgi:DNA-binding Lrp family transcriptional regulator